MTTMVNPNNAVRMHGPAPVALHQELILAAASIPHPFLALIVIKLLHDLSLRGSNSLFLAEPGSKDVRNTLVCEFTGTMYNGYKNIFNLVD